MARLRLTIHDGDGDGSMVARGESEPGEDRDQAIARLCVGKILTSQESLMVVDALNVRPSPLELPPGDWSRHEALIAHGRIDAFENRLILVLAEPIND